MHIPHEQGSNPFLLLTSLALGKFRMPGQIPITKAASVLEAAGCEWVFFETVGTGQTETEVLRHMDQKVLVLSPDSGDQYQMLKAGSIEAADLYVVNKSDRPGSESWAEELRGSLARDDFVPTVVLTNALTGKGIAELTAVLSAHPSL